MKRHPVYACLALASALLFGSTSPLTAQIVLSDGETHQIDGPSLNVEVSNGFGGSADPTTLIVVDGAEIEANDDDRSVGLLENSIFLMTGGELDGTLEAEDDSAATVYGGTIGDKIIAADNAIIGVFDVVAEDAIEAEDDGIINLHGGEYEDEVVAADDSTINIFGGEFLNVFSDGADLIAEGGTINVTGGVFGQAGVDDGGSAIATLGGTLNYSGGQMAGINTGEAPTATFSALINAQINLINAEFGDLVLEAGNNGVLNAAGYTAAAVDVHALAGGTVNLLGSGADDLNITAELGGIVNLKGGDFGNIDVLLESQGILNIFGHSFTFNGIPIENLDAVFGTPDAFIEETGEIRAVAGLIAGVLKNGDPFQLSFQRQFTAGARLFVQIVPEPNTIALGLVAVMTALFLRRD